MKVTKDTVRISEPGQGFWREGKTVQLKDADPNELQPARIPATIKGKSVKYGF